MNNRITRLFNNKKKDILNIYFTAGHPGLNDTVEIITALDRCAVDLVEVGMPYSDPLADGLTIQESSQKALKNGMTLKLLFDQIKDTRSRTDIPIILMGYLNQLMQYGIERFLEDCRLSGVDGLIIPDLPMGIYSDSYQELFERNDLPISFLITPETSDARIREADRLSSGFIYVVSKSSITGSAADISKDQKDYFNHLDHLNLKTPKLIGFGIHNRDTYNTACTHANGAIIGSAFIRALDKGSDDLQTTISNFIRTIR